MQWNFKNCQFMFYYYDDYCCCCCFWYFYLRLIMLFYCWVTWMFGFCLDESDLPPKIFNSVDPRFYESASRLPLASSRTSSLSCFPSVAVFQIIQKFSILLYIHFLVDLGPRWLWIVLMFVVSFTISNVQLRNLQEICSCWRLKFIALLVPFSTDFQVSLTAQ